MPALLSTRPATKIFAMQASSFLSVVNICVCLVLGCVFFLCDLHHLVLCFFKMVSVTLTTPPLKVARVIQWLPAAALQCLLPSSRIDTIHSKRGGSVSVVPLQKHTPMFSAINDPTSSAHLRRSIGESRHGGDVLRSLGVDQGETGTAATLYLATNSRSECSVQ